MKGNYYASPVVCFNKSLPVGMGIMNLSRLFIIVE